MAASELLCDYFALKIVSEDGQAIEEYVHTYGTCLLAQFPVSMSVRYCLVQLVRTA